MSKKLSIIGLGLIGSSILRGLADKFEITAYNRNAKTAEKAVKDGFAKKAAKNLEEAVIDADIIIIATPLDAYEDIAREIAEYLQPGTIVTDIGSVKTHAVFTIYNHMPPGVEFVPAHPIAGSEKTGYDAGDGKIFVGKKIVVTPLPKNSSEAILAVENLWKDLGALPEQMTPAEHDKIYALVSHVPQLLAYAYSMAIRHKKFALEDSDIEKTDEDFATFMRLSNSDAAIWADIFMKNSAHINKFLEKFFNGILHIENFHNLTETREKLGGKQKKIKLNGDKKIDAATLIFPSLMAHLLLFCIEDELENNTRSFDASQIHESLAMLETSQGQKIETRKFEDYAGTGLKDFTVFGLYDVEDIVENYAEEIRLLKALLHRKIFEITAAVESDSVEHLQSVLEQAKN